MIASGVLFITLNVADAWLTLRLLQIGGTEANIFSPFYAALGDRRYAGFVLLKGVLAVLAVVVLTRLGRTRLLKLLNLGMVLVVALNGVCFLGYLAGRYGWV